VTIELCHSWQNDSTYIVLHAFATMLLYTKLLYNMPTVMLHFALLSLRLCCVGWGWRREWRNTMPRGNTPAEHATDVNAHGHWRSPCSGIALYALRDLNNTKIWLSLYGNKCPLLHVSAAQLNRAPIGKRHAKSPEIILDISSLGR
jgi:hypothetical protein